ncbi:MAG TPA: ComF family protein [Vicinamibacterales bacterium]|nr:ComF family protein [Vicinamibacterales bacterium]
MAVLLAPQCLSCGIPLDSPTRGPVCAPCWASIRSFPAPVCDRCGDPLPGWRPVARGTGLCARCRRDPASAIAIGRSAGEYAGALRQVLHALKYDGRESLARPVAALMRERGEAVLRGAGLVVPVPLNWLRRWQRGFNQAEALARHLGLPVCHALVRARATQPQVGLPAARRHRNVRGAFRPAAGPRAWTRMAPAAATRVKGSVVVLVDDVATTGATLRACAEVLKGMGVREVRTLTAARAPGPRA